MLKLLVLSWLTALVAAVPTPTDVHSPEDNQRFREALEKSKTDDGYNLSERALANPNGSAWENSGKFEGDIILSERQIDALVAGKAGQRTASLLPNNKWPDNTVVYEFGDGEFDDGYNLSERALANPNGSAWENSGKFEGDIILSERQIDALVAGKAGQRTASLLPNNKWPDNTVVYEFGDGEFDDEQQATILKSIEEIEQKSCVRFRRKNDNDKSFVRITGKSDGCYAVVGHYENGGAHTMNLARDRPGHGCLGSTVMLHEWFHILGFFHMQSTHDRDDYIRILWENLTPGSEINFERYDSNRVSNLGVPYEYTSIMHYFATAFSKNGQPTMEALHKFKGIMGQQDYLTRNDWLRVNRHYDCPGAWEEDPENDQQL